jgi:hypothetical protein
MKLEIKGDVLCLVADTLNDKHWLLDTYTKQAWKPKEEEQKEKKRKKYVLTKECPHCGFKARGGTGLSSHIRGKHKAEAELIKITSK